MTDHWLQSAFTNDVLVADLLLRVKHSSVSDSDSDSSRPPPPSATTTSTPVLPPRWGHRKNRSKCSAPTTAVTNGSKEHHGSPTTHLSWSGGGSTRDGYDESGRLSDLSSGCRSVKVNESASTPKYHKFEKRKSYSNEHELTSMCVTLNQNKIRVIGDHELPMKLQQSVPIISCKVEAETVAPKRGFVLPDLNMTPNEEGFAMMTS